MNLGFHVVLKPAVRSRSELLVKSLQERPPSLTHLAPHLRVGQLECDVGHVLEERFAGKAVRVLDQDGARAKAPHGARHFSEEVSLVVNAKMLPGVGERLAGWSARNQVNWFGNGRVIELRNVRGRHGRPR